MRENKESRKKIAGAAEDREMDSDVMKQVKTAKEIIFERRNAGKNEGRVAKEVRMIPRPFCCACGKTPGAKNNGTSCRCGHERCAECMLLDK